MTRDYAERVEQLAALGGDSCYTEAAKLVADMAALNSPAQHTACVLALKQRFGRKRKFMQILG